MKGVLIAEPPDKFEQWLNQHRPAAASASADRKLKGASNRLVPEPERRG